MIAFYRRWFWLPIFVLVAGCASLSSQPPSSTSGTSRDGYQTLVPKLSFQQADVYFAYLTAQQYLRSNKIDKAMEAYAVALKRTHSRLFC